MSKRKGKQMNNLPHSYIEAMEGLQMENEQLRQRVLTLENQAKHNEDLDLVSEIDTELIVWINDTEKRAEMFKKAHHKDFEMVSSDFADAYRSVRDMIKEKSSR